MAQSDFLPGQDEEPLPNKADLLDYVADMIAELRDLANQTDCTTLAGILDVARLEAALQGASAKHGKRPVSS